MLRYKKALRFACRESRFFLNITDSGFEENRIQMPILIPSQAGGAVREDVSSS